MADASDRVLRGLRELRTWSLLAACTWQAVACFAQVASVHAVCGTSSALWALLLGCVFAALQAPLLHAQRALLLPAPRRGARDFSGAPDAAVRVGIVATAYPGRALAQRERGIFDCFKLIYTAAAVGAASAVSLSSVRQTSLSPRDAALGGVFLGFSHAGWMLLFGGRYAPFPAIPRPRWFRVKQAVPHAAREALYTALAALAVLLLLGAVSAVLGRGPLLADVRLDGAVLLAVTMLFVAIAMHVGLLLLKIIYTECARFLAAESAVGASAQTAPLRAALSENLNDAFWQHLAYEDLCFVAEKDRFRRNSIFADDTGASWAALVKAALLPVDATLGASLALAAAPAGYLRDDAALELRSQRQLAIWSIRALAALGVASQSCDELGVAQIMAVPSLGEVLARLVKLHIALRALPAEMHGVTDAKATTRANFQFGPSSGVVVPTSVAILADVVATALFTLADAFPHCADMLPSSTPDLPKTRAALAWFTQDGAK